MDYFFNLNESFASHFKIIKQLYFLNFSRFSWIRLSHGEKDMKGTFLLRGNSNESILPEPGGCTESMAALGNKRPPVVR